MRVLFATPWCLLDTTNGGAVSMRLLLRELARSGVECFAVNDAFVTDVTNMGKRSLRWFLSQRRIQSTAGKHRGFRVLEARDGPVIYSIADPTEMLRADCTEQQRSQFLDLVDAKMKELRPDVVLTWARDASEAKIHEIARRHGIPVAANVLTPDFKLRKSMVAKVDLILASSAFCAHVIEQRVGRHAQVLYPIVPPARVQTSRRGARYITFINPNPDKGLTVFLKIVERAQYVLPDARFLVVEGRWNRHFIEDVALPLENFPNVRVMASQTDVRRVYAKTRVLLVPSLWRESFGMIIVEAQANGIPVIASRRGGIPEATNGGGILLDPPARCVSDFGVIPNAREIKPWLGALDRLLGDAGTYQRASRQARISAKAFEPEQIVPVARDFLDQLVAKARTKTARRR